LLVVLDTNIICADFQLNGQAFRVFLETFSKAGNRCVVPAVVLDEIVKAFERQLSDFERKFAKLAVEWRRLTNEQPTQSLETGAVATRAEAYVTTLRNKLSENGIDILPYPKVAHEAIVRRAVSRSKPFREGDVGYRDTLIGETILELQDHERQIALISANSKDFAENGALHSELCSELERRKPGVEVVLFSSLGAFVDSVLRPSLARLETFGRDLERNNVPGFSLATWAATELKDTISGDDWGSAFVPLDPDHVSCWLSDLAIDGAPVVDDVVVLPSGAIIVAATTDVTGTLSVSPRMGAEYDRDVVEFFDGDLSGSPSATYPVTGRVSFTLELEPSSYEVVSVEIDTIETAESRTEVNPHPRRDG